MAIFLRSIAAGYILFLATGAYAEDLGSISSTGLYTAPACIDAPKTVLLQATAGGTAVSGTAKVQLIPDLSLNPTGIILPSTGGTTNVSVSRAPQCTWQAVSDSSWLTVSYGATGRGNGTIQLSASPNLSGIERTANVFVGSIPLPTTAGQPATITQQATAQTFADVAPSSPFSDFVDQLYQDHVTAGCSANPMMYCPDENIPRWQMAVFVVRSIMNAENFTYTTTPYYADVPPSASYFKYVQKMRDLNITSGCASDRFCPDDTTTRGQMAVFIIATRYETPAFSYPGTPYFTDVAPTHPFFRFIQKMRQQGITNGCAPTTYCESSPVTRGQMAVFLELAAYNHLLPPGTPVLTATSQAAGSAGDSFTATITGQNTTFTQGLTEASFGPGIVVLNVTVNSATSMTVQVSVTSPATPGPRSIVVTTGSEEVVLPNAFTIQ